MDRWAQTFHHPTLAGRSTAGGHDAPQPECAVCIAAARSATARVAARFRLAANDAEDLLGDLWVRLLAREGRVLRTFRRNARLETYLTAVAANLVIDRRRREDGKWRPSARARRGPQALVELEQLMVRDRLDRDVAVERVMRDHPGSSRAALVRLAESLSPRIRSHEVSTDTLADFPSPGPTPYDELAAKEKARMADRLADAVGGGLASLDAHDRDLMIWRYVDGYPVSELAARLDIDQKTLYRRFDRLRHQLRAALEARGFNARSADDLLGVAPEQRGRILRYRRRCPDRKMWRSGERWQPTDAAATFEARI